MRPRAERLEALPEPKLKRGHVPDDGEQRLEVGVRSLVDTLLEHAVGLHNVDHLLHAVAVVRRTDGLARVRGRCLCTVVRQIEGGG